MQWVFLYKAKKFQLKFSMHGLVWHNQNLLIKKKVWSHFNFFGVWFKD